MMRIIITLTLLTFASCGQMTDIRPFKLTIYNSNYSLGNTLKYVITDKQLKITFKGELEGEKDSTLFSVALKPNYSLYKLSNINIGNLEMYYENPCIRDGSQLIVKFDKSHKSKTIQLSNFYQKDIGFAIQFINSYTPKKYKIWYDKTILLKAQMDCK